MHNALSRISELRSDCVTGPHLCQMIRSIIVIDDHYRYKRSRCFIDDDALGSGRIVDEIIRSRNSFGMVSFGFDDISYGRFSKRQLNDSALAESC